jgi:hypothetical protein
MVRVWCHRLKAADELPRLIISAKGLFSTAKLAMSQLGQGPIKMLSRQGFRVLILLIISGS